MIRLPSPTRTLLLLAMAGLLTVAGLPVLAEEVASATPTASDPVIVDAQRVEVDEEAEGWSVRPALLGPGGAIPVPDLRIDFEPHLPHNPQHVIEVELELQAPVIAFLTGVRQSGVSEVFHSRLVEPADGNATVLWSVEPREGGGEPMQSFELTLAAAEGTEDVSTVVVRGFGLRDAETLSDAEVLDATSRRTLTLRYKEVGTRFHEQEAMIVVPAEWVRRHDGTALSVRVDGAEVDRVPVSAHNVVAGFLQRRVNIPTDLGSPGTYVLEAVLLDDEEEPAATLATETFRVAESPVLDRFEMPFQPIYSYAVYPRGPDLALIALSHNLYTREEPESARRTTREIMGHTVSLRTGRFESNTVWRPPAFGHWAEAGFRTLSGAELSDGIYGFLVTASNAFGIENVGLAVSTKGTPPTPSVINPVYRPPASDPGHEEGLSFLVRGTAAAPWRNGLLVLSLTQAGEKEPVLSAAHTNDMRGYEDLGTVPLALDLSASGHMHLHERDGTYYLLTDDSAQLHHATDPLGDWTTATVELPESWRGFTIATIGGTEKLFGLDDLDGKAVLRWTELTWSDDAPPLPTVRSAEERSN